MNDFFLLIEDFLWSLSVSLRNSNGDSLFMLDGRDISTDLCLLMNRFWCEGQI